MPRPSFAENKDFTDHGGSSIKKNLTLELKTPQTQKQLPAYIQNILNKGLTKPGSYCDFYISVQTNIYLPIIRLN